ncbi:hypothetical protein Fot_06266 [Forsythia ovata]|uniref:Uncharacterized protein n=1 Tax=Forsythia ovata TaxID=205694 RepID=A0ABD1WSV6_9LAMI
MVEEESQISILTKRLDDALNAQNIASSALEAANEEKRKMMTEALTRHEEISRLLFELEESKNGKAEAEVHRASSLLEVEVLNQKLQNAEAEFVANFHQTEA